MSRAVSGTRLKGARTGLTELVVDTPVRAGKGAVGGLARIEGMRKLTPLVALAASLGASPTLITPQDGYRVGSSGSGALGVRFSPRENGRLVLSGFGLVQAQAEDREDGVAWEDTGLFSVGTSLGASYNVWAQKQRSATVSLRGQLPLWQLIGDPMLAENWGLSVGVNVVAF